MAESGAWGPSDRRQIEPNTQDFRVFPQPVNAEHVAKVTTILSRLDLAMRPEDMDVAGLRLHSLKGDLEGFWSVTVRANWRIVFRFEGGNASDVDYLDYH